MCPQAQPLPAVVLAVVLGAGSGSNRAGSKRGGSTHRTLPAQIAARSAGLIGSTSPRSSGLSSP